MKFITGTAEQSRSNGSKENHRIDHETTFGPILLEVQRLMDLEVIWNTICVQDSSKLCDTVPRSATPTCSRGPIPVYNANLIEVV